MYPRLVIHGDAEGILLSLPRVPNQKAVKGARLVVRRWAAWLDLDPRKTVNRELLNFLGRKNQSAQKLNQRYQLNDPQGGRRIILLDDQ